MDPFEKRRMEMYKSGDHTYLRAATDQPLEVLRRANTRAARAVEDYRRAVRAANNYGAIHPGVAVDSLPPDQRPRQDIAGALIDTADPDIQKARRKLATLEAEVATAEAGVRRASTEVRAALGVGSRYLSEDETHPMLQRLREVEAELKTGSPQLKAALTSAKGALEDPAGGVGLDYLPGWEQDQTISIGEAAYMPEQPREWYEGGGWGRTWDNLNKPADGQPGQGGV